MKNSQLANLLRKTELFTDEQIEKLLSVLLTASTGFTETVIEQTGILEEKFLEKMAAAMGLRFMRLKNAEIHGGILARLPPKAVCWHFVSNRYVPQRERPA